MISNTRWLTIVFFSLPQVARAVGLEEHLDSTVKMLLNMYDMFVKKDALLVEINPYAEDSNDSRK